MRVPVERAREVPAGGGFAAAGGCTELHAVRVAADAAPGEIAVIRLIGMLPADWVCGQRVEEDRIWLRVHSAGGAGTDVVHERLTAALREGSPGWREAAPRS